MAVFCFSFYTFNTLLHSHSPPTSSPTSHLTEHSLSNLFGGEGEGIVKRSKRRRSGACRFVVLSTHSNSRILKSNRRSRFGNVLSPFDSDEEKDAEDDDDDDDDDDEDVAENDFLSNDDFAETADFDVNGKKVKSQDSHKSRKGGRNQSEKGQGLKSSKSGQSLKIDEDQLDVKNGKNRYARLSEEIELDKKWFPLLDYLRTFGLKDSHFIQMYERHMPSLQINVCSAQERLEYLLSVGVKHRDVKRIILRQPQILEYTVDNNLKSHVAFLMGLGIPSSRVGQIIAAAPSLFSYSLENSLRPTVRYLVEEVGINEKDLGAPRDSVVKMVKKHPQLLHYSIDDGLLPRINFLRSIGMQDSDILKVLTSLTQVLSLSLEENLKPKYKYLINELHNEVHSLTKYPMYLSLSLDQRIRPRHSVAKSVILRYVSTFQLIYEDNFEGACCTWYKFLKKNFMLPCIFGIKYFLY
ncbi:hypothetical protein CMV_020390 [Castanea mollissima]|uniref:Transcription termination factor MTERF9, chloroplastic n=1 Tax=Castanea mollissima TaxID=60419 RepID=A0A8J4R193_9ROSI|nr:hypothetical protein CMV_020390 [Castanea mollissima]